MMLLATYGVNAGKSHYFFIPANISKSRKETQEKGVKYVES